MPRVYSTITNSSSYVQYEKGNNDMPREVKRVTIGGGAGIAQKRTLYTPLGVSTEVSKDDLDFLEADANFQRHVKAGFLKVVRTGKADADVVAVDMQQRDGSAPLVPNDFAMTDKKVPLIGSELPITPPTTAPRTNRLPSDFR